MSKHTPIPVRRPHVADGFPHVGDVAPTYDIPVGRPHVADGLSCVGDVAPRVGGVAPTYASPDALPDPPCTP